MGDCLSDFFDEPELAENDLFAIFESLDSFTDFPPVTPLDKTVNSCYQEEKGAIAETETELETSPKSKRHKINAANISSDEAIPDGQQRMSHITVERNRRKQMNEHLSVLRSLMPCFYVKRVSHRSTSSPSPNLRSSVHLSILFWVRGIKLR